MSRQQMICFVTPGSLALPGDRLGRAVHALCERIGRVHFATLALLPPAPEAPHTEPPALLFEVVLDEDLLPADFIDLMLAQAFTTVWRLYRANWPGPPGADRATRRAWLRAFLIEHASVADGGFVGARDHSVAQARAEQQLFRGARDLVQDLPAAERPRDSAALAGRVRDWANQGFGWVNTPAPRSAWRKGPDFGVRGWLALALHLKLPVLAVLGLLLAFGLAVRAIAAGLSASGIALPDHSSVVVLLAALAMLLVVFASLLLAGTTQLGILGLLAAVAVCAVGATAAMIWGLGAMIWQRDLGPWTLWMDLTMLGLWSLFAFAFAAVLMVLARVLLTLRAPPFFPLAGIAVAMALAVGTIWVLAQLVLTLLARAGHSIALAPDSGSAARLLWVLVAAGAVLVTIAAGFLLVRALPRMAKFSERWSRPGPLPQAPAHQVHPSIQACESALSQGNRTSHMISLTEIRRPHAWHRFWLRLWLRVIHVLGETIYTEGVLGNARGIKFGHWHIIGNGRRLLFCSNFDSAFGGYLDDFIRGAAEGVNLVWRRTELRPRAAACDGQPAVAAARGFPPTRLGIFRGCKAEQAFKAYARDSMLPHLFRYEAYNLSHDDIERATRLREALRGTRSAVKDDQIARALES